MLNVRLNQYLTVTKQGDKMVQLICINHADIPQVGASASSASNGSLKIETYLIKTKTSQVRFVCALCYCFVHNVIVHYE